MAPSAEDWLRSMTDPEIIALVEEMDERREQFTQSTVTQINDEVRRRRLPRLVGQGRPHGTQR